MTISTARPRPTGVAGLISWLVYPAFLAAVPIATAALLARELPRPLASGLVILAAIVAIFALERIAPLHRKWNALPAGLDLILLAVNRLIDIGLIAGTVAVLGALGSAGVHISLLRVWPTEIPLALQGALGIAIGEVVRYALHRASHRPGFLWRIHRMHHEPTRMYTLNGPRLHPANSIWVACAYMLPMLLLGADVDAVIVAANTTAFVVLFQHANVQLRFDGLNRIFATPDVHRLHHASEHGDVNYAIVFVFIDAIFGTYRRAEVDPGADAIGLRSSAR
jgi:ornithine lipid hydroxylase